MRFFTKVAMAIVACSFLSFQSKAQDLRLGLKAGASFDKTQGRNLKNEFNGTILGGAFLGIDIKKVRVQGELLFSQSKITTGDNFKDAFGNYVDNSATSIRNGDFKMNELSVPVLVGFNILPKRLWLMAGPQYTGVVSIDDVHGLVRETKDVFKTGYLSGVVGAELELILGLNAGVRYVFGISDRNNTNVSESWRTSHIQVHLGFSFIK